MPFKFNTFVCLVFKFRLPSWEYEKIASHMLDEWMNYKITLLKQRLLFESDSWHWSGRLLCFIPLFNLWTSVNRRLDKFWNGFLVVCIHLKSFCFLIIFQSQDSFWSQWVQWLHTPKTIESELFWLSVCLYEWQLLILPFRKITCLPKMEWMVVLLIVITLCCGVMLGSPPNLTRILMSGKVCLVDI